MEGRGRRDDEESDAVRRVMPCPPHSAFHLKFYYLTKAGVYDIHSVVLSARRTQLKD